MQRPSEELLEQAILLLAETCQADMEVLFVAAPSPEAVERMIVANAAWEAFSAAHPEVEAYAISNKN